LLTLVLAGCGGKHPITSVTGKVTVGGTNPLPGGNITFYLSSDPTQVGGSIIKSDGTFEVVNAPVGECKVVVDNTNLSSSRSADKMMGGGMTPMGGGMGPGAGAQPQPPSGPSAQQKEKMQSASKSTELDPAMAAGQDTGNRKYVKIDPAYTKVETTTLRHTVNMGENKDILIDVK
jgi:hypothetical protein